MEEEKKHRDIIKDISKDIYHKMGDEAVGFMKTIQKAEEKRAKTMEEQILSNQQPMTITHALARVTEVLEIFLSVLILLGFLLALVPILAQLPLLTETAGPEGFATFLEHSLELAVGVEFVRMLIKHTPGAAIEVLLFAIARHMVVGGGSGLENLYGVLAIMVIFIIRKYFYVHSIESKHDDSSFDWVSGEERAQAVRAQAMKAAQDVSESIENAASEEKNTQAAPPVETAADPDSSNK